MGLQHPHYHRRFACGQLNKITDVAGLKVGHANLRSTQENIFTGVTALSFHEGNAFREKLRAGAAVINGFGKSCGLIQIQELGQLESPILLTNTLSVGSVLDALNRRLLAESPEIGSTTGTVNAVVCECNDGQLNDIRALRVGATEVEAAFQDRRKDFAEGGCGAGSGMVCFGMKGGIGSSSRCTEIEGRTYTIGCLVLSNFGRRAYFAWPPEPGNLLEPEALSDAGREQEKGSCIIILASDLPFSSRQLKRLARRASVGLIRCGSYLGNGSGDIAIAVSTAERIPHEASQLIRSAPLLHEDLMDRCFAMVGEAVEEAVLSSLWHAEALNGKYLSVPAWRPGPEAQFGSF